MTKMKRFLLTLTLISFLAVTAAFPVAVLARHEIGHIEPVPATLDIFVVLNRVVNFLFTVLLIVAAVAIVIAAYYFVAAAGDPERVAKARQFVIYALVGVAVALAARGLVLLAERLVVP
jgi:hypothetical protein